MSIIATTLGNDSVDFCQIALLTLIGQPSFSAYMGLDTAPNADALTGATIALFFVGGFFGAMSTWWIADRFGHKIAIATGSTIVCVAGALAAGSVNITMFIVFRFFTGWGYLAESEMKFSRKDGTVIEEKQVASLEYMRTMYNQASLLSKSTEFSVQPDSKTQTRLKFVNR